MHVRKVGPARGRGRVGGDCTLSSNHARTFALWSGRLAVVSPLAGAAVLVASQLPLIAFLRLQKAIIIGFL